MSRADILSLLPYILRDIEFTPIIILLELFPFDAGDSVPSYQPRAKGLSPAPPA